MHERGLCPTNIRRRPKGYARRLLRAAEAAGLCDEDTFPWDYYRTYSVATVREYAAGQFPEGSVWYSACLEPGRCHEPAKTARALRCSTDYLLGLSDDLTPAMAEESTAKPPQAQPEQPVGQRVFNCWMPGGTHPGQTEGLCAVLFDMGKPDLTPMLLWWDGRCCRPGERRSFVRTRKTGDPCPCCGRSIRYTDPNTLRTLAMLADREPTPDRLAILADFDREIQALEEAAAILRQVCWIRDPSHRRSCGRCAWAAKAAMWPFRRHRMKPSR